MLATDPTITSLGTNLEVYPLALLILPWFSFWIWWGTLNEFLVLQSSRKLPWIFFLFECLHVWGNVKLREKQMFSLKRKFTLFDFDLICILSAVTCKSVVVIWLYCFQICRLLFIKQDQLVLLFLLMWAPSPMPLWLSMEIHTTCLHGLWASYQTARMLSLTLQRFVILALVSHGQSMRACFIGYFAGLLGHLVFWSAYHDFFLKI